MNKASLLSGLMALFVALATLFTAPPVQAAPAVFYVPLNRAELVSSDRDLGEVIVTDPDVADVFVHGKRKVSVIGKHIGQTTLRMFDANRKLVRSMDVYVTYDLPAIRRALKQFLPGERVGVSMVNTRIALTGDVTSAQAAATALEVAEEFVRGKLSDDQADARKTHDNTNDKSPIINLMKVAAAQQVMLRIKVGEVQRSAVKNLGVGLQAFGNGVDGLPFLLGSGLARTVTSAATTVGGTTTSGTSSFRYGQFTAGADAFVDARIATKGNQGVGAVIEALERDGLLKVLAEPNLTALSGEEAQFLAGGEFPIPVPQQLGTTTIEYKPYGVALKFTPYVINENRIRIQVNPEVSEISNESAIRTTDGFTAPSIVTRRASTTVELAPGESFMIAGLLSDNTRSQIDQLPGAGNIPILGALFRSTSFQRNETELVITVTPYLVDPVKDGDLKLPTDDFRPASFMESVFFGALGSNRGAKDPSMEGPSGFMTDN